MADGTVQTIDLAGADGLRLSADVAGPSDGPPVLFMHGAGQTRQSWGRALHRLGHVGWRAYSVDHRGHGDSDWPDQPDYEHQDMAADCRAIVEAFDRPPLVVGSSLGGLAMLHAQGSAGVDQQLFRAMVLVDITPRVDIDGAKRVLGFMASAVDGFATLEEAAAHIGAYRNTDTDAKTGARHHSFDGLKKVLRERDGRWYWHWDPRYLEGRTNWLSGERATAEAEAEAHCQQSLVAAATVRVPTLLVRGGFSDLVTPEAAQELVNVIPESRYVDIVGAGHMVAGDRNDLFCDEVEAFAAELPSDQTPGGSHGL